ncbi:MAG: hypothetical protein KDN19_05335 [Verrucomicrobiae bacterium]|nr:hypothetical protein [Verrucomicrobiae bacterium]
MEAPSDHSVSRSPNLENPEAVSERSRFLNVLGFGRSEDGEAREAIASESPLTENQEVEKAEAEAVPFPAAALGNESAPKVFEPLESLDEEFTEESETKSEGEMNSESRPDSRSTTPVNEQSIGDSEPNTAEKSEDGAEKEAAALASEEVSGFGENEEKIDEGDAHDPDGMALRGDSGGPDFLASQGGDFDDWESELMVGDDFEPMKNREDRESEPEKTPEGDAPNEMPADGGFSWMMSPSPEEKADGGKDQIDDPESNSETKPMDEDSSFSWLQSSERNEAEPQGDLPMPSQSPMERKSLDFETFSERLKSAPLWKAPAKPIPSPAEVEEVSEAQAETGKSEEAEAIEQSIANEPISEAPVANPEIETEPAPAESEPANFTEVDAPAQPEIKSEAEAAPVVEEIEAPKSETEAVESTWAPPVANRVESVTEPSLMPAEKSTPDDAPIAEAPNELKAEEEKPVVSIAPRTAEIIDVACPQCGKGLSLRREHLGIAGHCVWCESPLVAAASPLDEIVRIFLLKPGTESTEQKKAAAPAVESLESVVPLAEKRPEMGRVGEEVTKVEAPAAEMAEREPVETPWSKPDSTGSAPAAEMKAEAETETETEDPFAEIQLETEPEAKEEIEGETVEPEVLGEVEEKSTESDANATGPAATWMMPGGESAATLWAERAAAVQQSLSGNAAAPKETEGSDSKEPSSPAEVEQKPIEPKTPISQPKQTASAFSWMDPKPLPEGLGAPMEKEEKTEEEARPKATDEEVAAPKTESLSPGSPFDWKPPAGACEDKSGETDLDEAMDSKRDQAAPVSNDPFAGISAALEKAATAEKSGENPPDFAKPSSEKVDAEEPFEDLTKFLSDSEAGDEPASESSARPLPEMSEPSKSLWPGAEEKKASDDPFGGDFSAESDEKAEAPAEASGPSEGSEEKPTLSSPLSSGSSLFSTGDKKSAEPDAKAPAEEAEKDEKEPEAEAVPVTETKKPGAEKKAVEKTEKTGAKDKKAKKEKPVKAKKKPVAKEGGKGGKLKWVFLAIVLLGLAAGIAVAVMFGARIKDEVMPVIRPLLEKVMPSKAVEESTESASIPAEAPPVNPSENLNVPLPSPPKPAAKSPLANVPQQNQPVQSSKTPSKPNAAGVASAKRPTVVPVPEKENLFGGGPLLIHDGAREEKESSE